MIIMPKSIQESEASPVNMVAVVSNTKLHEVPIPRADTKSVSARVQEEQVDIDEKVEEEEDTNTKPDNQVVKDTTRLKQLETDNTVRCSGDNEEQNEAPNLPSCEKEADYILDDDDESICTVQISELDDLLSKAIDEALECERSLRQEQFLL